MPSMDIVNKLEMLEVATAVDQARKEVVQRYDFKNTNTQFEFDDKKKTLAIRSNSTDRIAAAYDVLLGRMVKRNVSPKCLDAQANEELPGGTVKRAIKLKDGIDAVAAKKITNLVRESFPKVQASINGELVRCSSKSRDELQSVIASLRAADFELPLQFINFRD